MILELDVGNSRIKWRTVALADNQELDSGFINAVEEAASLEIARQPIDMVRMCSVRAPEPTERLGEIVQGALQCPVKIARVSRSCGGVTNHYTDVSRLGIDRWLAMVAGFNRADAACMVIDAGTAVTVDIVSADGNHQGGYIAPGLNLSRKALLENTRIRFTESLETQTLELGHSSESAVIGGTLAMLVGFIDKAIGLHGKNESNLTVYLTGGDAELLESHLDPSRIETIPGLVMDGLTYACPWQR